MKITPLILAALFFVSCAKDNASLVNQSAIYTSYAMSYDDSTKAFQGTANFNFGGSSGTYLVLDGNSSVTFDGNAMAESQDLINQVIYSSNSMPAQLWSAHTFLYTDTNGVSYTNSYALPNMPQASYPSLTVSSSSSLPVNWTTPDIIGVQGSIYVQVNKINGPGGGTENAPGDISNSTSGTVTLSSDDLSQWGTGGINIQVCRQNAFTSIQAPAQGGVLLLTTCTDKTTVQITN